MVISYDYISLLTSLSDLIHLGILFSLISLAKVLSIVFIFSKNHLLFSLVFLYCFFSLYFNNNNMIKDRD